MRTSPAGTAPMTPRSAAGGSVQRFAPRTARRRAPSGSAESRTSAAACSGTSTRASSPGRRGERVASPRQYGRASAVASTSRSTRVPATTGRVSVPGRGSPNRSTRSPARSSSVSIGPRPAPRASVTRETPGGPSEGAQPRSAPASAAAAAHRRARWSEVSGVSGMEDRPYHERTTAPDACGRPAGAIAGLSRRRRCSPRRCRWADAECRARRR
jgi:hypothetical protein